MGLGSQWCQQLECCAQRSEDWVWSNYFAEAAWLERVRAVWEDLQAESGRHFGSGGFVPAVASGWFPGESAQLWGYVVVEAVALLPQQIAEER